MRAWVAMLVLAAAPLARADDSAAAPASTTAAAPTGGNAYLSAAKRLYADLEYEKALEQLERARAVPGTTPAEMAEIEKYTGMVKYELGDANARSSFRTALALDPKAELPATASPKIKAEWMALKHEMEKADAARTQGNAEAAPKVAAKVEPPPPVPKVEPPPPAPKVDVPPAKPRVAQVEPTQAELKPAPHADAPQLTQPAPEPGSRSMVSTVGPWALVGVGAVAGGVGACMGISSSAQTADAKANPIQVSAAAQQQTAKGDALAANVLYAAAGAAVVAGVIWYFTR